jgi:transcriptional regulator with XRE-family HTH domain
MREEKIYRARELYADGLSQAEVADVLGVATNTVQRWSAEDDVDWGALRKERAGTRPHAVLRTLKRRFARLAVEAREASSGGRRVPEDRLLKILKVIDKYTDLTAGVAGRLEAIEDFLRFCVDRLPEEEVSPVRGAVRRYVNHIRRENA